MYASPEVTVLVVPFGWHDHGLVTSQCAKKPSRIHDRPCIFFSALKKFGHACLRITASRLQVNIHEGRNLSCVLLEKEALSLAWFIPWDSGSTFPLLFSILICKDANLINI